MNPPSPNSSASFPVFVSIANRRVPEDTKSLGLMVVSPGQYPRSRRADGLELPALRASHRIERKHAVLSGHIHDVADDQRRALEESRFVTGVECPCALQRAYVVGVDLIEGRVLRMAGILSGVEPV